MSKSNIYTQQREEVCAITGLTTSEYIWSGIKKAKAFLSNNQYAIELHKDESFIEWWTRQWYIRDQIFVTAIYHYANQLFTLYATGQIIDASHPHQPLAGLFKAMPAGVTTDSLKSWLAEVFEPSEFRPNAEMQPLFLPPCILQD